jgi:hypothetical protein
VADFSLGEGIYNTPVFPSVFLAENADRLRSPKIKEILTPVNFPVTAAAEV